MNKNKKQIKYLKRNIDFEAYFKDALKSYGYLFPTTDEQMFLFQENKEDIPLPEKFESPDFIFENKKKQVMNNYQLQRVNFVQAKLLEKIGFNWECDGHFYACTGKLDYHLYYTGNNIKAPTVQLALKWFRDVKGALYDISSSTARIYSAYYYKKHKPDNISSQEYFTRECVGIHFNSFEEAESALLDELIKLSINDKK